MTVPAVAIERLRARHNRFDCRFVAAQTIRLDNAFGFFTGSYCYRNIPRRERVYVFGALSSFFEIVHNHIIMWQVTVYAFGEILMWGVIPIFVLRIHHMAVRAGFWCASTVGRCVCDKDKETKRYESGCDGNKEWEFGHGNPLDKPCP